MENTALYMTSKGAKSLDSNEAHQKKENWMMHLSDKLLNANGLFIEGCQRK